MFEPTIGLILANTVAAAFYATRRRTLRNAYSPVANEASSEDTAGDISVKRVRLLGTVAQSRPIV
jgi:hypothetical protein